MFKCDNCKKISNSNESLKKLITKTRAREYKTKVLDSKGFQVKSINGEPVVKTTRGYEIVQEKCLCNDCYEILKDKFPTPKKEVKIEKNYSNKWQSRSRKEHNSRNY